MAKSAPHIWVEARPTPITGTFKNTFCTFFSFCAVLAHWTSNKTHSQITLIQPVIYFTNATANGSRIQLKTGSKTTFTVTTREKLLEASPKRPGPTHLRALAGQRSDIVERTLVPHGLKTRLPTLKYKTPQPEIKNTLSLKQIRTLSNTDDILKIKVSSP